MDSPRNERLRAAMAAKKVSTSALAEHVGVDTKTVERWINRGRLPHRVNRELIAERLDADAAYLWPESEDTASLIRASQAELIGFYPSRAGLPMDTWTMLIDKSVEAIDLLAFGGSFLHDSVPDCVQRLARRARDGVRIRLLFGDPDSAAAHLRGEEEGIGDMLAARCRHTWNQFAPLIGLPNVTAAEHGSTLYNSIFRFDSEMLINTHRFGSPAGQNPIIHLHAASEGTMFSAYLASYEAVWREAKPLGETTIHLPQSREKAAL